MQTQLVSTPKPRRISRKLTMHDPKADTLAPPTDRDLSAREEPTNPLAAAVPATMLPPAAPALKPEPEQAGHGAGEETKLLSTNQLIALYSEFKHTQSDILSETGGFARLLERRDERLVSSFARLVDESVRGAVHELEPRFRGIERELAAARRDATEALERVKALEERLKSGAAGPEAAAAPPAV